MNDRIYSTKDKRRKNAFWNALYISHTRIQLQRTKNQPRNQFIVSLFSSRQRMNTFNRIWFPLSTTLIQISKNDVRISVRFQDNRRKKQASKEGEVIVYHGIKRNTLRLMRRESTVNRKVMVLRKINLS